MLEIKGLTKIYRSKKGEEVRALDNVSISFPETGMVFILGKSGSGKSTLLNIMGGLDSYNSGEFIIKGKSSRDFGGSDFDAYRNTFIGFIFQEYNVLDDFTVGANIALALELQGKKATSEAIGSILAEVDLVNFAKRKPNELSGGQKQRVAIARALVKDPQIIMADEPTGALDSNTGKQIFDTLKKLSEKKLVLVVSHDRDFAERYADRIVELADGRIISDVTRHEHESEAVSKGIEKIGGSILRIKAGYTLTAEDLTMINAYLAEHNGDILLSGDGRVNSELRSAAGISETGATAVFETTNAEEDYALKHYEKKDSRFIRSRLPLKNAVRIGAGGLKHKKFRLVMTVFLSLIAFSLFGFADTLAAYRQLPAAVESLEQSNVRNASFSLGVRYTDIYGDGSTHSYYNEETLNDADIEQLKAQTGLNFVPVFTGGSAFSNGFEIYDAMTSYSGGDSIYDGRIKGLVAMTDDMLAAADLRADAGRLPEAAGEVAITELLYRQLNKYGFKDFKTGEEVAAGALTMTADGSQNSIIGKYIQLNNKYSEEKLTVKIVGVVDTKFNYDRYSAFLPADEAGAPGMGSENTLARMVLEMELSSELNYGFHTLAFAHEEDIETLASHLTVRLYDLYIDMSVGDRKMVLLTTATDLPDADGESGTTRERHLYRVASAEAIKHLGITWLGEEKTSLAQNEIILPIDIYENLLPSTFVWEIDADELHAFMTAKYGDSWAANRELYDSVYDAIYNAACDCYWAEMEGDHEAILDAIRNDVFPFFLAQLGVDVPEAPFRFTACNNYASLEEVLHRMTIEENTASAKVYNYEIEQTLRYLAADVAVQTHDLTKNDDFKATMNRCYGNEASSDDTLLPGMLEFYAQYYLIDSELGYMKNPYGPSGSEINAQGKSIVRTNSGVTAEQLAGRISFQLSTREWRDGEEVNTGMNSKSYTVVGFYTPTGGFEDVVISDTLYAEVEQWRVENLESYNSITERAEHESGIWAYALAPMPKDKATIRKLVSLSYTEDGADLHFEMRNYIIDTLDSFNEFIEIGAKVFLYVGLALALFAALLLMNFIATSISYKKREIGVLRAVGARSSDVFKIFFSEALIIALINFVCSTAVVIGAIIFANNMMHAEGITVTLLSYGIRQFILMLAISVGVALLASFFPVFSIARKKPVDTIKDR